MSKASYCLPPQKFNRSEHVAEWQRVYSVAAASKHALLKKVFGMAFKDDEEEAILARSQLRDLEKVMEIAMKRVGITGDADCELESESDARIIPQHTPPDKEKL